MGNPVKKVAGAAWTLNVNKNEHSEFETGEVEGNNNIQHDFTVIRFED